MNQEEREQAARVLTAITHAAWGQFLTSVGGSDLRRRIDIARAALVQAGVAEASSAGQKPVQQVLDLLGDRLLGDGGPSLRALIIRSLSGKKWEQLREAYRGHGSTRAASLHGGASQQGKGAQVVASYWRQGGRWAHAFCRICELPEVLAARRADVLPEDEIVESATPLPPLHTYQREVYAAQRALLRSGRAGENAVLSLPTGAGKTRVTVEALVDHLASQERDSRRNVVLWLSHSDELLRQAWTCFRQVWQTPPQRWDDQRISHGGALHLRRAWGGVNSKQLDLPAETTVIFGGVQQLRSWADKEVDFAELWPLHRLCCVIIDEAHRVITSEYAQVLSALGVKKQHRWEPLQNSPPVLGLTATPWRSTEAQSEALRHYFGRNLVTPESLGKRPIAALQESGFLSAVQKEELDGGLAPEMTQAQRGRFETFHDLPPDYVAKLGELPQRNGRLLGRLLKLPKKSAVLVFACSVEHAEVLTLALNRAGRAAACVHAATPRDERLAALQAFQDGELGFLCNFGVLTTGFDAPRINVVCIARPTMSELLYEQMVGRGLRGPKNGGTAKCLVLDVQDEGLPGEVMSYARVVRLWEQD